MRDRSCYFLIPDMPRPVSDAKGCGLGREVWLGQEVTRRGGAFGEGSCRTKGKRRNKRSVCEKQPSRGATCVEETRKRPQAQFQFWRFENCRQSTRSARVSK